MSLILEGMGQNGHLILEGFTQTVQGEDLYFSSDIPIELLHQVDLSVIRKFYTGINHELVTSDIDRLALLKKFYSSIGWHIDEDETFQYLTILDVDRFGSSFGAVLNTVNNLVVNRYFRDTINVETDTEARLVAYQHVIALIDAVTNTQGRLRNLLPYAVDIDAVLDTAATFFAKNEFKALFDAEVLTDAILQISSSYYFTAHLEFILAQQSSVAVSRKISSTLNANLLSEVRLALSKKLEAMFDPSLMTSAKLLRGKTFSETIDIISDAIVQNNLYVISQMASTQNIELVAEGILRRILPSSTDINLDFSTTGNILVNRKLGTTSNIELFTEADLRALRKLNFSDTININSSTFATELLINIFYEHLIMQSKVTTELEFDSYFGEKLTRWFPPS